MQCAYLTSHPLSGGTSIWTDNGRLHLSVFDGNEMAVEASTALPTDLTPHDWVEVVFTISMSATDCQVKYALCASNDGVFDLCVCRLCVHGSCTESPAGPVPIASWRGVGGITFGALRLADTPASLPSGITLDNGSVDLIRGVELYFHGPTDTEAYAPLPRAKGSSNL
jgi:hypothetical protein